MPKMTNSALKAMLASQYSGAVAASNASKLSGERADAMSYYNGDMSKDMPAMPGRSAAVSMDVADTVEGILPQLMEIFCGNDEVVKFGPVGPEDVQAAEQETDYINHVFMNRNPGFLVLYSFIKDALLSKVGVVKVWWEKTEREEKETYLDKTEDEYALIVADPDVEVVEHTEHPADQDGVGRADSEGGDYSAANGRASAQNAGIGLGVGAAIQPQTLHDVTVVTKKKYAQAHVLGVPPEEFGIEAGARNIRDCNYCFHKIVNRTEAELIEMGYDPTQVKALPSYRAWSNTEENARDTVAESMNTRAPDDVNASARLVEITEHYVRMDYEDNGKPCLYRVTTGGKQGEILLLNGKPDIIEFDAIPFAAMTPIIVTHRFYGKSLADLVMDVQKIKTALTRGLLDNIYLALNVRTEVPESHASENTLDDLLVSRPGGIVRTKAPGGLRELGHTDIGGTVYPALEYFDQRLETRTGASKRGQGIEPDALLNQSATAAKIVENASQARVRLIARIFAETGIKDLFWLLHGTVKKHGDQAQIVRLKNNWVTVDPREWKTRDDLTVHVGLGTGGRAQEIAELTLLANFQKDALINGLTNLVTVQNIYSTAAAITKAMGRPNVDAFFTDPKTQPPLQPKPDPKILELQMKAQTEHQALQSKAQLEQQKSAVDTQHQIAKTQADMALAEKKFELEKQLKLIDAEIQIKKHSMDMEKHHAEMQARAADGQAKVDGAQIDVHLATRKMDLDHKARLAEKGMADGPDGQPTVHPGVVDVLRAVADSHQQLMKAVTAPRKTAVHRDPKTGRVAHAVSSIEAA